MPFGVIGVIKESPNWLVGYWTMCFFDTSFWQGFLGNLLADLVAALIIAVPVALIVNYLRWAEAKVVLYAKPAQGESPDVVRWQFQIKNIGRVSFRPNEIYWHILVDHSLRIRTVPNKDNPTMRDPFVLVGETSFSHTRLIRPQQIFYHWKGLNKGPVFPNGDNLLLIIVDVEGAKEHDIPVYFYLSTAHGQFPIRNTLWTDLRMLILRLLGIRKATAGTDNRKAVFEDYGLVERVNHH